MIVNEEDLLHQLLFYTGIFICLSYVLRPAIQFVLYLLPERDLKKIYGDGWAIVTGATDGIGKALAFELAHRGFKVCLISRSAEKLKQVEKELVAKYKVSTATVQIDFARARESNFLEEPLAELQKVVDSRISILINNAGVMETELFEKCSLEGVHDEINVNCLAPILLTRALLPHLKAENSSGTERTLVVGVASGVADCPQPYFAVYSGTKVFTKSFIKTIEKEGDFAKNIDFMCLKPHLTTSNMTGNKDLSLFLGISAEDCANGFLRMVGKRLTETEGHWKHELSAFMASLFRFENAFGARFMLQASKRIKDIFESK